MAVRAKFRLDEITSYGHSKAKTLVFRADYDQQVAEEISFSKATPSGQLTMLVDNPAALEQFELGKKYYLDFTLA